jgi:branched-chain amino acid aminotransferase
MATLVNLGGRIMPPEEATVSIFDRSFLYGDSVYETLRTYGGVPFEMRRHLARLEASMRRLRIDAGVALDEIGRRVEATLAAAANPESYIRIIVSRGAGDFGLAAGMSNRGDVYVIVRAFVPPSEDVYRKGFSTIVAKTRRTSRLALDPAIKSGNYLNNLLGLFEARDAGADDAIFLNEHGLVTEASTSSLFVVHGERVRTPPLVDGILDGVTRHHLIAAAAQAGSPVVEESFREDALRTADEIFITSTLKEVMPVRSLDGVATRIPAPGPVTLRLRALLSAHIRETMTRA